MSVSFQIDTKAKKYAKIFVTVYDNISMVNRSTIDAQMITLFLNGILDDDVSSDSMGVQLFVSIIRNVYKDGLEPLWTLMRKIQYIEYCCKLKVRLEDKYKCFIDPI